MTSPPRASVPLERLQRSARGAGALTAAFAVMVVVRHVVAARSTDPQALPLAAPPPATAIALGLLGAAVTQLAQPAFRTLPRQIARGLVSAAALVTLAGAVPGVAGGAWREVLVLALAAALATGTFEGRSAQVASGGLAIGAALAAVFGVARWGHAHPAGIEVPLDAPTAAARSEERRVGKEC